MKKVLLDENLPRPLKNHFSQALDVTTVPDLGWQSLKNGALLAALEREQFDVLITADRNLKFQQNLDKFPVQVVVLLLRDNRYKTIAPLASSIEDAILQMEANEKLIEVDLRTPLNPDL